MHIYRYGAICAHLYIIGSRNMKKNPRRRPDKITAPDLAGNEIAEAIFHAVKAADNVARQMEDKWGVDKLPTLVSAATAAKFGSAKAKFDLAILQNDVDDVVKRATVMARGWKALDAEAERNGHRPIFQSAWTWRDDDGMAHAFVRDTGEAFKYGKQHPGVVVWTIDEIIRVAAAFRKKTKKLGVTAKAVFTGAVVTKIDLDDEIPF